jgi:hypothetical protein
MRIEKHTYLHNRKVHKTYKKINTGLSELVVEGGGKTVPEKPISRLFRVRFLAYTLADKYEIGKPSNQTPVMI